MDAKLDEIEALADQVSTIFEDTSAAYTQAHAAQSEFLETVVQTVGKRALTAIGSRPKIHYKNHNCDVNCRHEAEQECMPDRAVLLSYGDPGPEERRLSGTSGEYCGNDLFVDDQGRFFQLSYSGHWTQWQNGWKEWNAEITRYANAREAVEDGWEAVERYAANLANKLKKYTDGNATTRASQARERAAKLQASTVLLK